MSEVAGSQSWLPVSWDNRLLKASVHAPLRAYRDNRDDIAAVSQWIATSTISEASAAVGCNVQASS
ncbi:MAG TPA: hypothetical protein VF901_09500 [Bradyrhizobium sp.]